MGRFVLRRLTLFAVGLLLPAVPARAQVTTATLYGIVVDESGSVLPGATVTVTHEGTALTRTTVTNETGAFALSALPIGPYTVRIELQGFRTQVQTGLSLAGAQTVRQTYKLALGEITEDVTVEGVSPLVNTASSQQLDTIGTQQVRELPASRRNVTGLLRLAAGVDSASPNARSIRFNGVGIHGTGISVDGTDANANPEGRGMSQFQGENYIDTMSIEAVQEVQLVRGIMPAEYGGIVGGQVNLISRSGSNTFHGSLFENYIDESLGARDVFLPVEDPKPSVSFNQFGGSLGGPIVRNRAFFFTTYEGYREDAGMVVQDEVPTQALREEILEALPFAETQLVLDTLPLPTEPIDEDIGFFVAARNRERRENHVVGKGDVQMLGSGRLSLTYTRMRPFSLLPRINTNGSNDRTVQHEQDRVAATFVYTFRDWVSESRVGYNRNNMQRVDAFFLVQDPAKEETNLWGRRIGLISVAGLFATQTTELWDMEGTAYSIDQKISRSMGNHLKLGIRWVRQSGDRSNPENPVFGYQSKADLLANIPSQVRPTFGAPPHTSHMDEMGGFIQDDWRVSNRLVLNLGLRYDYYGVVRLEPATAVPVQIVNLEPPSDLRLMDFGAPRPADQPYEPDGWVNFGPRAGIVWTLDDESDTVIRAGSGVLFSPQMPGMVRQGAANPLVPFRVSWGSAEAAERGLRWPSYNEEMMEIVEHEATARGQLSVFSLVDPDLQNPYTIQSMVNLQRAIGPSLMVEIGYQRVDGRKLILQRQLALAIDRETGRRINPDLGSPGGYYIDNNHSSEYNALQLSVRKRFSDRYSFDVHYTYGGGTATSGGDIGAYYQGDYPEYTQDFWNPEADRGPLVSDARHRLTADILFEVPFSSNSHLLSAILGGWQIAGIYSYRSGEPLRITQPSAIPNSRPDYAGGDPVLAGWRETRQYLNPDAFALVPLHSESRVTVRPGNVPLDLVRGPGSWTVDLSVAKSFALRGGVGLQVRAEAFNTLNHPNYGGISTDVTSSAFGQIRSAGSPRQIQLGARLTF